MSSNLALLSAFALAWHLTDASLNLTRSPRNGRLFWVGVGVGWSLWMFQSNYRAPRWVECK